MVDTRQVVRIDMCRYGDEVVTLEDVHGQLEHVPKKLVPVALLEKYAGEVHNRFREE